MEDEMENMDEKLKQLAANKNASFIKLLGPLGDDLRMALSSIKLEQLTYLFPNKNRNECKKALDDLQKAVALTIQINQNCLELYKKELSETSTSTDS